MNAVVSGAFDAKIAMMTHAYSFHEYTSFVHNPGDEIGAMHVRYLPRTMSGDRVYDRDRACGKMMQGSGGRENL